MDKLYLVSWKEHSLPITDIRAKELKPKEIECYHLGYRRAHAIVTADCEAEAIMKAHESRKELEV